MSHVALDGFQCLALAVLGAAHMGPGAQSFRASSQSETLTHNHNHTCSVHLLIEALTHHTCLVRMLIESLTYTLMFCPSIDQGTDVRTHA